MNGNPHPRRRTPAEFVEFWARRRWWWSPQPFWEYVDSAGQGWGNMDDVHPGCFNLAWGTTGVRQPLPFGQYPSYAHATAWVITESQHIPMANRTMAHWAFVLPLGEFVDLYTAQSRQLKRWKFHDKVLSYDLILARLQHRLSSA